MSGALVDLSPASTLSFRYSDDGQSKETLSLSNSHDKYVFFKIKTTTPRRYCVRPTSGKIAPGQTVVIEIGMQGRDDAAQVNKDKFLVQTIFADGALSSDDVWPMADKSQIGETKLRCTVAVGSEAAADTVEPSPSRQAPVHAPYSGRHSLSLSPTKPTMDRATEESELARVVKINQQLKDQNAKLEEELAFLGDGLRQRGSSVGQRKAPVRDFAAPKPPKQSPLPALIVALLIGWAIGHFLRF